MAAPRRIAAAGDVHAGAMPPRKTFATPRRWLTPRFVKDISALRTLNIDLRDILAGDALGWEYALHEPLLRVLKPENKRRKRR